MREREREGRVGEEKQRQAAVVVGGDLEMVLRANTGTHSLGRTKHDGHVNILLVLHTEM